MENAILFPVRLIRSVELLDSHFWYRQFTEAQVQPVPVRGEKMASYAFVQCCLWKLQCSVSGKFRLEVPWTHLVLPPAEIRVNVQISSGCCVLSSWALKISKNGDYAMSVASWSTTSLLLRWECFFLVWSWNFLRCSVCPLLLNFFVFPITPSQVMDNCK